MTAPSTSSSRRTSSPDTGQQHSAIFMRSLDAGGGERVGLTLARAFSERGYSVELIVTDASGPYRAHVPDSVRLTGLAPVSQGQAYWQISGEWRALPATLPALVLPTSRLKRLIPYLPALRRYFDSAPVHSLLVINTYTDILAMWGQREPDNPAARC